MKTKIVVPRTLLVCLVLFSTLGSLVSPVRAAAKFNIGDTVEVTTNLNVRTGAGTSYPEITDPDYPGYAPAGTKGKVLDGPVSADGYIWWKVDYGPGQYSGWSVEGGLEKVVQPPPPPTITSPGSSSEPGSIISDLTPTLQWNAVSEADYYALAISIYPYGSGNIIYNPQQLTGTSHTVPSGTLEAGKKYRWNMQAHNSAGWSDVSNTLYFQTSEPTISARIDGYSPSSRVEVTVGESTTISVTFTNTGDTAWNFIAGATVWDSGGSQVANYSQTLSTALQPGRQKTVSWNHPVNEAGDYWLQFGVWKDTPYTSENLLDKEPSPSQNLIRGVAAPQPTIDYSPSSFSFSATQGGSNPSSQTLSIRNSGGGTLNWSVSDDAGWLSLSPTTGTSTGETDSVGVSVTISGMSAGSYSATITISASGATNTPQTVPVSLTINEPSTISARIDGYSPSSRVEVTVGESTTISVTFTNTGDTAWNFIAGATVWDSGGSQVANYSQTLSTALQPGRQKTVSWNHPVNEAGDYWLQFGVWKDTPYTSENLLDKEPSPSQNLIRGVTQVQPPPPPTITSPGSSSEPGSIISDLTPTLQWNAVSEADYYALAISVYPYGSGNIIYNPQQLTGTSHTVPSGTLEAGKKYRWNMQAHNSAGWSDVSGAEPGGKILSHLRNKGVDARAGPFADQAA